MACVVETRLLREAVLTDATDVQDKAKALHDCLIAYPNPPIDPSLPISLSRSLAFPSTKKTLLQLLDYTEKSLVEQQLQENATVAMGRQILSQTTVYTATSVLTALLLGALGAKK